MKYRAVIFDLDGTLLDTIDDIAESMNSVLRNHGFPVHSVDRYKIMVGDGLEVLAERALPIEFRDDTTIQACARSMESFYSKNWDRSTKPYPGVATMLQYLQDRDVRMSIFSNKPHEFAVLMVSRLLSEWRFEMVLGARDGVPKKPDPKAAITIARALSIDPSQFLYLGDTNTDMKTAVAAGMVAVGVLWGFRGADELLESGARILLEKPEDIREIIG
jgi:phosphoglycolate phosphatase